MALGESISVSQSQSEEKKLYWGFCPMAITMINPTKKELEAAGMNVPDEEPNYIMEDKIRIQINLKSSGDTAPLFYTTTTFFIGKKICESEAKGKAKYIDKFGNTCWLTKEEFENKSVPDWINSDIRPCLEGEEELTKFIKAWANMKSNTECRFDNIKKWFKGDFAELKNYVYGVNSKNDKLGNPEQSVTMLIRIKNTDKGQFMSAHNRTVFRNWQKDYSKLINEINERKSNSQDSTFEDYFNEVTEYKVESTDLKKEINANESLGTSEKDSKPFAIDDDDDDFPFKIN